MFHCWVTPGFLNTNFLLPYHSNLAGILAHMRPIHCKRLTNFVGMEDPSLSVSQDLKGKKKLPFQPIRKITTDLSNFFKSYVNLFVEINSKGNNVPKQLKED